MVNLVSAARVVVISCARYAGLGVVAVPRATITLAPGAGTAGGRVDA